MTLLALAALAACRPAAMPRPRAKNAAACRQIPASVLARFVRHFPDIYREGLRRASPIEEGVAQLLRSESELRERPVLERVYRSRRPRLRFVGTRGVTAAGATLVRRLAAAPEQGLDLDRQGMDRITGAIAQLERAVEQVDRLDLPRAPGRSELERLSRHALPPDEQDQALLRLVLAPDRGLPRLALAFERDRVQQSLAALAAARVELLLAQGLLRHGRQVSGGLLARARLQREQVTRPSPTPSASQPTSLPGPEAHMRRALERALRDVQDEASLARVLARLEPAHEQYRRLQPVLARYRQIVASGGWSTVPVRRLRPGHRDRVVAALKQRLAAEGYYRGAVDRSYDAALVEAVRAYQGTHQLEASGRPDRWFWRSLNVPAARRLRAVEITLQRWRDSAAGRPPLERGPSARSTPEVLINIPGFHTELWQQGKLLLRQKVVVGRSRPTKCDEETRRTVPACATPLQSAWIGSLVFSPFWIVTRDIKQTELDPERGKDPLFYEKHGYEVMEADKPGEWVRELPGPANSLGFVKFLFPNRHETYLHGTPVRHHFRRQIRANSHGCIRLEHPLPLARLLLRHDGQWSEQTYARLHLRWQSMDFRPLITEWDPDLYETLRARAQSLDTRVELRRPVPIHVEYFTVRVDDDGRAHFLADIYGLDQQRINPRPARRCIPESSLARRGVQSMIQRVEALERQATALAPCSLVAATLARGLDPKGTGEVRRLLKQLEHTRRFPEAHANLARLVRSEHGALMQALEQHKGRWRESLVKTAIRVERLLQGLETMTHETRRRCARMVRTSTRKK